MRGIGIIPYGMDILEDGTMGPGSIGRLQKAYWIYLEYPEAEIVVSVGLDPTQPNQTVTLADQQTNWLILQGVPAAAIRVGISKSFNTEGEQDLAISCQYAHEIHVSSWWHLPRIRLMRHRRGVKPGTKVSYRGRVDIPPLRGGLLEPVKFVTCLLLPESRQQALAIRVKRLMRTSY